MSNLRFIVSRNTKQKEGYQERPWRGFQREHKVDAILGMVCLKTHHHLSLVRYRGFWKEQNSLGFERRLSSWRVYFLFPSLIASNRSWKAAHSILPPQASMRKNPNKQDHRIYIVILLNMIPFESSCLSKYPFSWNLYLFLKKKKLVIFLFLQPKSTSNN